MASVERMRALLARHGERARTRLFTHDELADCGGLADDSEYLAARFAAKEAALKALGTGKVLGILWTDVEIKRGAGEQPMLRLSGGAARKAESLRVRKSWLSLTHDAGLAIAAVILEGDV